MSSLFEHHKVVVDAGQTPLRIDRFLVDHLPNVTRTRVQAAIEAGNIQVNGGVVKANYKVRGDDLIQVMLPTPPRDKSVVAESLALDIVYEDTDLLVLNKPAGMVVHPAHNNWTGTLVNALVYHFNELPTSAGNTGRPGLVHRIDKGTSGLLVVAKTEHALAHLGKQFMEHTISRRYVALVWGVVAHDEGTINIPIGRSPKDRRIMIAYQNKAGGKDAITHYKVLERFRYATLVACSLETGRTHQIRAHLSYLGYPLFADSNYQGDTIICGPRFSKYEAFINNCLSLVPHPALHAGGLGFLHPRSGKALYFEVPLPENFARVVEKWRRYSASIISP